MQFRRKSLSAFLLQSCLYIGIEELVLDDPGFGETRKIKVNFCVGVMERGVLGLSLCGCWEPKTVVSGWGAHDDVRGVLGLIELHQATMAISKG
jgi:hypothetical protein